MSIIDHSAFLPSVQLPHPPYPCITGSWFKGYSSRSIHPFQNQIQAQRKRRGQINRPLPETKD